MARRLILNQLIGVRISVSERFPGSSKLGRMPDLGSGDWGSIPCPGAVYHLAIRGG